MKMKNCVPLLGTLLVGCTLAWTLAAPHRVNAATDTSFPAVMQPKPDEQVATLAAGCFWSMEAIFKQLKGVDAVQSGYSGGKMAKPTYEDVETGTTGYAESLNVIYNPKVITYRQLLQVLLTVRNPTTVDLQGNDAGPQYRSVIFFRNAAQHETALAAIKEVNDSHVWPNPIVTQVQPFARFSPAENYHVNYYALHPDQPYCSQVIAPEISEFRAKYKSWLKS